MVYERDRTRRVTLRASKEEMMASERKTPGQAAFEEGVRRRVMLGADSLHPWSGIDATVQADWEAIAQESIRARYGYTVDSDPKKVAAIRERFGMRPSDGDSSEPGGKHG
jgi:hypothetical protein